MWQIKEETKTEILSTHTYQKPLKKAWKQLFELLGTNKKFQIIFAFYSTLCPNSDLYSKKKNNVWIFWAKMAHLGIISMDPNCIPQKNQILGV